MPPSSVVKVAVAGAEYSGWTNVDIDSDVFTPADAWHVSGRVPSDPEFRQVMREGALVDVYIDDDRQMTGVIDRVGIAAEVTRASVSLDGRDKGAFLVDCEAKHIKAQKYTLRSLAEELLLPEWGIKNVIIDNGDNRKLLLGKKDKRKPQASRAGLFGDSPRRITKIDPGTRVAAILDTRTRQLGVTWWLTAQGDLFIGKPSYQQEAAYEFRCYAPSNPKCSSNNCSMRIERGIEGRYSKITMVGRTRPSAKKSIFAALDPLVAAGVASDSTTKHGVKIEATATDPDLVARGIRRETITIDNDALDKTQLQNHVNFDMAQRRLGALRIYVSFPSFRYQENGANRLFATDTLAHVEFEEADISGTYYVCQRRYVADARTQATELTLVEKGVWLA